MTFQNPAVVKPPIAKIAKVFSRLEAFTLSIFIFVIVYIQMAGSSNVQTFASAQIFYSAGFTGLQILQQIFIADTSDLLNRAFFSSIQDIPSLITVWVGAPIASSSPAVTNWRWGYGLWAIVLPVAFLAPSSSVIREREEGCKAPHAPSIAMKRANVSGRSDSFLTFSFTFTVAALLLGPVIKYTHHYKYYITAGSAIYLLGVGLMIRYRVQGSSTSQIVGTQIAVGIGGGLISVPSQLGVQAFVAHQDVAAATAIFLTIVEIGGAVGSAISGAVWTANIPAKLQQYLPPSAQADAKLIFGNLTLAESYAIGSPERIAINRSYQETMNILLIIAACLAVPLLPLSLMMKNYRLGQMDQRVKGNVVGQSDRRKSAPADQIDDPSRSTYRTFADQFKWI